MNNNKQKPNKSGVVIIATNVGFILFLYLATYIAELRIFFSPRVILILEGTEVMSLIGGLGLFIWLLISKHKFYYIWTSTVLYILSMFLIEYWYFVNRLLSLMHV